MKKLLLPIILSAGLSMCMTSYAEGWHHGGGHYVYRPNYGWVVPTVIGGVIGYEIARPVQPNVVYVQPQPVYPPPAAPVMPQPATFRQLLTRRWCCLRLSENYVCGDATD